MPSTAPTRPSPTERLLAEGLPIADRPGRFASALLLQAPAGTGPEASARA
jgi:hypothetical protein